MYASRVSSILKGDRLTMDNNCSPEFVKITSTIAF